MTARDGQGTSRTTLPGHGGQWGGQHQVRRVGHGGSSFGARKPLGKVVHDLHTGKADRKSRKEKHTGNE
jgi:hypothetical protein